MAEVSGRSRARLRERAIIRFRKETEGLHFKLALIQVIVGLIPYGSGSSVRTRLYRLAGFKGISRTANIGGRLQLHGNGNIYERLHIGGRTWISTPAFIDLNEHVTIGNRVGIGHHLIIVTSNHQLGPPEERMGRIRPAPVMVEDGGWLGAQVTILPGVTVGPGAFVTAGAVVTKDVPANARVAGNHAQVVGYLKEH